MMGWSRSSDCPVGESRNTRCTDSIDDSPGPPARKNIGVPFADGGAYTTTGSTTGINFGSPGACRFCGTVTVPHFTEPRCSPPAVPHCDVHGNSTNFGIESCVRGCCVCATRTFAHDSTHAMTAHDFITLARPISHLDCYGASRSRRESQAIARPDLRNVDSRHMRLHWLMNVGAKDSDPMVQCRRPYSYAHHSS